MARPVKIGPDNILDAAERTLLAGGCSSLTLDTVASLAHCAKGLVHYHFGTRTKLLVAANDRLWDKREKSWVAGFRRGRSPEDCIRDTWTLLSRETTEGITRGWVSLLVDGDGSLHQAVRRRMERFEAAIRLAAGTLLESLHLTPSIPLEEWSRLLVTGINGVALQLVANGGSPSNETDYAALWLSALGLTTPADG